MIIGIGTDMASISRIGATLNRHGDRFVTRCFAPAERDRVEETAGGDSARLAAGYAKRWAAKEACAKALGLGIRNDIFLKDIVVTNDDAGRPSLVLSGGAQARLQELTPAGMTAAAHVSLTDEDQSALAFVVLSVTETR